MKLLSTTDTDSTWMSRPARCNVTEWKYDVFLSFRGEDTRSGFIGHLFYALRSKQISTFLDENLKRGEEVSKSLFKKIEESYISVVIFSKNYADSPWCLDELVKIYECTNKESGQIVLPIFYQIDPSDVQDLKGRYSDEVLSRHGNDESIKEKRSHALREIAGFSGYVSSNFKYDLDLIKDIVNDISERLYQAFSTDTYDDDGLVGIHSRVEEIKSSLSRKQSDVRILGIWGAPGVGKTTVAGIIFDQFSSQFRYRCFIKNVSQRFENRGSDCLGKEIIYELFGEDNLSSHNWKWMVRRKVLIVLDDVSDYVQIDLVKRAHHILGAGSIIIMTSRDQQVLKCSGADLIYKVEPLEDDEALQLFSFHAFRQKAPTKVHKNLAKRAIRLAQGIPLALEVFGCHLYQKDPEVWEDKLEDLERTSDEKIEKILRISYEALGGNDKKIFLDIACFFNLEDKDHVQSVLGSFDLPPKSGIESLCDKSLITISNDHGHQTVEMHALLQQMGKDIVLKECNKKPEKSSRLWIPQDIYKVLKKDLGIIPVEKISLNMSEIRNIEIPPAAFERMDSLKFLEFYSPCNRKDRYYPEERSCYEENEFHVPEDEKVNVHLPKAGLTCLPDELRYLYWYKFSSKSLPLNFWPVNLVQLHLIHSNIEQLCDEDQSFENLKILNLSYSMDLICVPDLSAVPKLEVLCLRGCTSLVEIRSSLRNHKHLSHMDLGNCKNFNTFPWFTDFTNLSFLSLAGCSNIRKFRKFPPKIRHLMLDGTGVQVLPSTITPGFVLTELSLKECTSLSSLPSTISWLKCLRRFNLNGCSELASLPNNIGELKHLERLYLDGCSKLMNLPDGFCNLKSLEYLNISDCLNLKGLPENFGNLESLEELLANKSGIKMLPSSINGLNQLVSLDCIGCEGLILPPFTGLSNLKWLNLKDCGITEISNSISSLVSIESLRLGGNRFETLPASIEQLSNLSLLHLWNCKRLVGLPDLPSGLEKLVVNGCTSLERVTTSLPKENWDSLCWIGATNCMNLNQNECIKFADDMLQRLEILLPQLKLYNKLELDGENNVKVCQFRAGFCIGGDELPERMRYKNKSGSSLQCPLTPEPHDFILLACSAVVAIKECGAPDFIPMECQCRFVSESGRTLEFLSYCSPFVYRSCYDWVDRLESEQVVFWQSTVHFDSKYSFKEASFDFNFYNEYNNVEVVKCGVHILYDDTDTHLLSIKYTERMPTKFLNGSSSWNWKEDEEEEEGQENCCLINDS